MSYIELINEFWRLNGIIPFGTVDTTVYMYLLHQCNVRGWQNPFPLPTKDIEFYLSISRKQIGEVRKRLIKRGLIKYSKGSRKDTPIYKIIGLDKGMVMAETETEAKTETKETKVNRTEKVNETNPETESKVKEEKPTEVWMPALQKPIERTREEIELEKFDALLQEVVEGKHQIWADQMRKMHGIDNVTDYLSSFRDYVIANATVNTVTDINGFKRYFNCSFRYFIKRTPVEILMELKEKSKSKDYVKFCDWMIKKAENVARNINPMTEEELDYLVGKFDKNTVFETIIKLNNRDDLVRKYFSLYRTLLNWLEK